MGNFSVSHYTRLHAVPGGIEITYVLDLAEVPAFELLKQWKMEPSSPQAALDARAAEQAREWIGGLSFQSGGQKVTPELRHSSIRTTEAPGGLFTARVESLLRVPGVARSSI